MNRMAELFGTSKQNINYHLQNIYNEKELQRAATVKEILTVQNEGGPALWDDIFCPDEPWMAYIL